MSNENKEALNNQESLQEFDCISNAVSNVEWDGNMASHDDQTVNLSLLKENVCYTKLNSFENEREQNVDNLKDRQNDNRLNEKTILTQENARSDSVEKLEPLMNNASPQKSTFSVSENVICGQTTKEVMNVIKIQNIPEIVNSKTDYMSCQQSLLSTGTEKLEKVKDNVGKKTELYVNHSSITDDRRETNVSQPSIAEDFTLDDSMDEDMVDLSEIYDYDTDNYSNNNSNDNSNQHLDNSITCEDSDSSIQQLDYSMNSNGTSSQELDYSMTCEDTSNKSLTVMTGDSEEAATVQVKRKKRPPAYKRNMIRPEEHNFTDLTKLEPGNNECHVCKKIFKLRNKLLAHFTIHPPENPHLYDLSKKTSSLINVKVVPPTPEEIIEKPFVCALCPKRFRKYGGLEAHCCVHTGEKPYVCNVCSKAYRDKQYLVGHGMLHTGKDPHVCDICNKVFTRRQNLETHYLTHTGEKPHVCDICGRSFRKKNLLVIHNRIHTNEFPFSCKECDRGFRSKRYLINHALTHSGEKPHVCDICGRSFAHKSWLLQHHDLHTGKRPYECIQCYKTFARRIDLQFHINLHAGVRPFVCQICNKGFTRNCFLKRHLSIHGKGKRYIRKRKIITEPEDDSTLSKVIKTEKSSDKEPPISYDFSTNDKHLKPGARTQKTPNRNQYSLLKSMLESVIM